MADIKFRTKYPDWQPQYPAYKEALSKTSPDTWYRQEPARFLPIFDKDYPEIPFSALDETTQRAIFPSNRTAEHYIRHGTPIEGVRTKDGIWLEGHPTKMERKPLYKYGPLHEYRHEMTANNPNFYYPNPPKEVLNELRALLKRFGTYGLESYDSFDPSSLYDEYMAFLTEHVASNRKMPPNIVQQNPFLMEIMMRGAPSNIWHGDHNPDPLTNLRTSPSEMPSEYVDPSGKYRIPLGNPNETPRRTIEMRGNTSPQFKVGEKEGSITNSPRSEPMGWVSDKLKQLRKAGDFVVGWPGDEGKQSGLGSLLLGESPELTEDIAFYGPKAAVKGGNVATGGIGTLKPDKRNIDLLGTLADVMGPAYAAGKLSTSALKKLSQGGANLSRREALKKIAAVTGATGAAAATPAAVKVATKALTSGADNVATEVATSYKYNSLADYLATLYRKSIKDVDGFNDSQMDLYQPSDIYPRSKAFSAEETDRLVQLQLKSNFDLDEDLYNMSKFDINTFTGKQGAVLDKGGDYIDLFDKDGRHFQIRRDSLEESFNRVKEFSPQAKQEMRQFKENFNPNLMQPEPAAMKNEEEFQRYVLDYMKKHPGKAVEEKEVTITPQTSGKQGKWTKMPDNPDYSYGYKNTEGNAREIIPYEKPRKTYPDPKSQHYSLLHKEKELSKKLGESYGNDPDTLRYFSSTEGNALEVHETPKIKPPKK